MQAATYIRATKPIYMSTESKFPEKKALPNAIATITLIIGCLSLASGILLSMQLGSSIQGIGALAFGISMIISYAFIDLFICIEYNQRIQIYYIDDTKLEHLPKD